eukprot:CAMPEP_0197861348 /NCGR_PEP_ID=MMETSP1438-20131217/37349_1 /TAXON_ID=1461541 /ORGANISM="Pterosperma sp., Strain CCMP1384" /LENGTH=192 /DNA_ID=CAMNT_0043478497 /DNA_START=197 /DNA_END=775 /DNA_ORIENTATION=+
MCVRLNATSIQCKAPTQETSALTRRQMLAALPLLGGLAMGGDPAEAVSRAYTSRGGGAMTMKPGEPGSVYCVEDMYYERTGRMLDCMLRIADGSSEDYVADIAFFEEERPKWLAQYTIQHMSKSSGRYVLGFDATCQAALGLAGTIKWCPDSENCVQKPFDPDHTLYNKDYMIRLIQQAQASNAKGAAALSA